MADYAYRRHLECVKQLGLSGASGPEAVERALNVYWNNMLMDVTAEIPDHREREIYRVLLNQSRQTTGLLACFQKPDAEVNFEKKGSFDLIARILLRLAVAAAVLCAIWFLAVKRDPIGGGLTLLLGVFFLLQLILDLVRKVKPPAYTVSFRLRLDVGALCAALEKAAVSTDANAVKAIAALPESSEGSSEIDMIRELVQIKTIEQVDSLLDYLTAKNGITKVEYSPETEHLFNIMPSTETRTLEPALVKGTEEVLYTGTALVKKEEA